MPAQEQKAPVHHVGTFFAHLPFYAVVGLAVLLTGFCEIQVFSEFIPQQFWWMRFTILAFTEGGGVGWVFYAHYKAETTPQLFISIAMTVVCILTSLASVVLYLGKMAATSGYDTYNATEGTILTWVVIIVIPVTIFAVFGVLFSTHKFLSWFLGASYKPLPPRPHETPRQQYIAPQQSQPQSPSQPQRQQPTVRIEEERPQKQQQKQPQLPSGGQQALPAPKNQQNDFPVQQPSQHLPGKWGNDSSPLPAQSGGKPPYQNPKRPLPEQVAHRRPPQVQVMEDIPRNPSRKAQEEAAARDRMMEEQPTTVLQQNHSPSEQMGDWD